MATRMLIDASHDEETRVVIVNGTRLEEFDYETASKKQLKGNIYLAKVTRVEPSLQAAFVEYGGNRHGFLPFSEIHPDYYQVPVSDREELIAEETIAVKEAEDVLDAEQDKKNSNTDDQSDIVISSNVTSVSDDEDGIVDDDGDTLGGIEVLGNDSDNIVENLGGDDEAEIGHKIPNKRHYKIQEVIKRRQILLIQVVKEERGNKGAALTTYISLPGRYSVLMPNTGRGGGISRKISNPADRKRLKKIASELEVPEGIGVIIRTAGLNRTKLEIKRDYEFLLRLWDDIRELTLKSMAPSCVYEEANLIKRSIRDLYSKEISEILVEGDEGYRIAKDFMRKLMPSHAKKVQPYRDRIPLFHRFQVEQQFASMYNPEVQLKSGGYIVINPTEALVSVDVNSGKATKERNIEDTALKTNMEAAEEMARQLRLRDLAGLIVIDFIDMDDNRNNKAVERKLKDCLKSDRARIQVGRISPFGLLEMSRQRLRPSFLETSTNTCHTCGGSGFVRSTESTALLIIRSLEEEGVRERSTRITVTVHTDVAIYLLNQKRSVIQELETLYGITILIMADPTLNLNDHTIDREKSNGPQTSQPPSLPAVSESSQVFDVDEDEEEATTPAETEERESNSAKRRRRRRRRKTRDDDLPEDNEQQEAASTSEEDTPVQDKQDGESDDEEPRRRRRGKRGGRRRARSTNSAEGAVENEATGDQTNTSDIEPEIVVIPIASTNDEQTADHTVSTEAEGEEKPKRSRTPRRRSRSKAAEAEATGTDSETTTQTSDDASSVEEPKEVPAAEEGKPEKVRPRRRRAPRRKSEENAEPVSEAKVDIEPEMVPLVEISEEKPKKPVRKRTKKVASTDDTVKSEEAPAAKAPAKPAKAKAEPSKKPAAPVAAEPEKPAPKASSVSDVVIEVKDDPSKPKKRGWWSR